MQKWEEQLLRFVHRDREDSPTTVRASNVRDQAIANYRGQGLSYHGSCIETRGALLLQDERLLIICALSLQVGPRRCGFSVWFDAEGLCEFREIRFVKRRAIDEHFVN